MADSRLDHIEQGLRGKAIKNLLEGWTFHVDEVSSNLYRIDAFDGLGHRVTTWGIDPEKALAECVAKAKRSGERRSLLKRIRAAITPRSRNR